MKKRLLTSLFLFINFLLFSQIDQSKIKFSDEKKIDNDLVPYKIVNKNNETFIIYQYDGKIKKDENSTKVTAIIEKYDNNLKLIFKKDLIVKYKDEVSNLFGCFNINEKIYLGTNNWNKSDKTGNISAYNISDNGEIIGNPIELINYDNNEFDKVSYKSFKINKNGLLFCGIIDNSTNSTNANSIFVGKLFDLELKYIKNIKFEIPNSTDLYTANRAVIDNNNNIYFDYACRNKDKKLNRNFLNYLICYNTTTNTLKSYDLKFTSSETIHNKTFFDKQGNLIYTGFTVVLDKSYTNGYFYIKISAETNEVLTHKIHNFDAAFYTKFFNKPQKDLYMGGLYFDNIFSDEEGNLTLVGENRFFTGRQSENEAVYRFNFIYLQKIDTNGNMIWWAKIDKKQIAKPIVSIISISYDMAYFSYDSYKENDNICILYNDKLKNIEPGNIDPSTVGASNNLVTIKVTVDKNGGVKKEQLFDANNSNFKIFTFTQSLRNLYVTKNFQTLYQLNSNKVLFWSIDDKIEKLTQIEF
jgi:hypothetical protein